MFLQFFSLHSCFASLELFILNVRFQSHHTYVTCQKESLIMRFLAVWTLMDKENFLWVRFCFMRMNPSELIPLSNRSKFYVFLLIFAQVNFVRNFVTDNLRTEYLTIQHSRPQRPRSLWSAPRIAVQKECGRCGLWGREWYLARNEKAKRKK